MSDSRVERMFGPRESWGRGGEMDRVRERAVRQEGGGPELGRGNPAKKNVGGGRRAAPGDRRSKTGNGAGAVPYGAKEAGGNPVVGEKKAPSVSKADSSPMLAHRGAKGNGTQAVPYGKDGTKKAGFNRGGGAWGGLAGFVSIRCECGRVVNTCLHQRTPVFRCKDCGGETDLAHVANIHMKCNRCGFVGKYRTNRTEEKIQMECLNCSDIVYLTKIRRGNYVVEGEQATGEGL